jgi:restriction system protein
MVRAGSENELASRLEQSQAVAVGWEEVGDLTGLGREDIKQRLVAVRPDSNPRTIAGQAGQLYRFAFEMREGDFVVSFLKESRQYLVGKVSGPYRYEPSLFGDGYHHIRPVVWSGKVARDALTIEARNTLGSTLTVFEATEYRDEVIGILQGKPLPKQAPSNEPEEVVSYLEDVRQRAVEFIGDAIGKLDGYEFQSLVAGVLRAMGYKTQESPIGPDGGIDIRASPDGALLSDPIIRVQVKHRKGNASSGEVQQLVGALGNGVRGLFVSTGGFSKDARREADRAKVPVTLIDDQQFITLLTDNYERLEVEFRSLMPLGRVWVPLQV